MVERLRELELIGMDDGHPTENADLTSDVVEGFSQGQRGFEQGMAS